MLKLKIKVNGKTIEIFSGAKVKDVIRKYSVEEYKKVQNNKKVIKDPDGNIVMPNGELIGDEEFFIVENKSLKEEGD